MYLSVIFPAYNESTRIVPTLESAFRYFMQKSFSFEIIVVDDGSDDGTAALCRQHFAQNQLKVLRLKRNSGKGFAVKKGIEAAAGDFVLFADADNSTPIEEFDKFLPRLAPGVVLIGSRFLQPETIERPQPWYRIAISRVANAMIRALLIKKVRDTQCGFKVFHRSVASLFVALQHVHRFGFDLEYLTIALQNGIAIEEIPVRWINSPVSRIRPVIDTLGTFRDFIKIKYNAWRGRYRARLVRDL